MPRAIFNQTRKTVIASRAEMADTISSRMRGLLNRDSLNPGEALIITHCQSIHMLFMKFSIDAIFVDRSDKVVGLAAGIAPFCFSPIFWNASYVIELNVGTIEKSQTALEDRVEIQKES